MWISGKTPMTFHIMTLFPEMFDTLKTSIIGRAIENGIIGLRTYQIRDFSADEKHHKVDDYTYGGGAGMLMQAQPVFACYEAVLDTIATRDTTSDVLLRDALHGNNADAGLAGEGTSGTRRPRLVYVTPQGKPFTQDMAREYARADDLIILCGHYEGVDERVLEATGAERVSIGDYVLTGGELPAMVLVDAIARMVKGVLSNEESAQTESFDDGLLEYPQYTRPEVWNGMRVPDILLSGDHAKVDAWRMEQRILRTREVRPDLLEQASDEKQT